MRPSFAIPGWRLMLIGLALIALCSVNAQNAGRRPGQAIIFSSPDGDDVSSNLPSLTAKPPALLDSANAVQPPSVNFGATPPVELPPMPLPRLISPAEAQRMQRQLDQQNNWALMTPEQILGLPTPEKILGIQDRNAFGQPKNETVVEQFYQRQDQLRARTNSLDYAQANKPHLELPGNQDTSPDSKIWNSSFGSSGNSSFMDQLLKGKPDNSADASATPRSGWFGTFGQPTRPAGSTPEQQTAAAQFQQLLNPQSSSGDTEKSSLFGSSPYSPPSTAHKSASSQSALMSFGDSSATLNVGIPMPVRAAPLPSLFQTNNPLVAPTSEWKPDPPPWMSPTPQLGAVPQRKF